jgi:hypothetical protein
MIEVGKHGERQQEQNVLPVTIVKIKQQRYECNSNVNNEAGHCVLTLKFWFSRITDNFDVHI